MSEGTKPALARTVHATVLCSLVLLAAPANDCGGGTGGTSGDGGTTDGGTTCPSPPVPQPSLANLRYGSDSANAFQELDVYLPTNGASPAPVIVVMHGGLTEVQNPTPQNRLVPAALLSQRARGWAIASLSVRPAVHPGQIHDVKRAVQWLRQHNADTFGNGLDTQHFVLAGASGGGFLAAMAGLTDEESDGLTFYVEPDLDPELVKVQGIVDWQGPDLWTIAKEPGPGQEMDPIRCAANPYLNCLINGARPSSQFKAWAQLCGVCDEPSANPAPTCNDLWLLSASPHQLATADDPPIYLAYGGRDTWVTQQSGIKIRDAFANAGLSNKVWYDLSENAGHTAEFHEINMTALECFLDKVGDPLDGCACSGIETCPQ